MTGRQEGGSHQAEPRHLPRPDTTHRQRVWGQATAGRRGRPAAPGRGPGGEPDEATPQGCSRADASGGAHGEAPTSRAGSGLQGEPGDKIGGLHSGGAQAWGDTQSPQSSGWTPGGTAVGVAPLSGRRAVVAVDGARDGGKGGSRLALTRRVGGQDWWGTCSLPPPPRWLTKQNAECGNPNSVGRMHISGLNGATLDRRQVVGPNAPGVATSSPHQPKPTVDATARPPSIHPSNPSRAGTSNGVGGGGLWHCGSPPPHQRGASNNNSNDQGQPIQRRRSGLLGRGAGRRLPRSVRAVPGHRRRDGAERR